MEIREKRTWKICPNVVYLSFMRPFFQTVFIIWMEKTYGDFGDDFIWLEIQQKLI
jgi:hypothetical protein